MILKNKGHVINCHMTWSYVIKLGTSHLTYHVLRHVTNHETRYTLDEQEVYWLISGRSWEWSIINEDMWHQWKDSTRDEGELLLAKMTMTHCTVKCSLGSAIVSNSIWLNLTHTPIYGIITLVCCSILLSTPQSLSLTATIEPITLALVLIVALVLYLLFHTQPVTSNPSPSLSSLPL